MFRYDAKPTGHRKPAPMLAVSGTAFYRTPTGHLETRMDKGGVRCPARNAENCPHARARAQVCVKTHVSNGLPDTASNGAGFRCPALQFVPDTPDTLTDTSMDKTSPACRYEIWGWISGDRAATSEVTVGHCPFCKSNWDLIVFQDALPEGDSRPWPYVVICGGCGTRGPWGKSEQQAVEKWNAATGTQLDQSQWVERERSSAREDGDLF